MRCRRGPARDQALPVAEAELQRELRDEARAPQALGHPGRAGEGLRHVGPLPRQLPQQGEGGGVPGPGVGALEQAVDDLAQPDPPPVLGDDVEQGEAAGPIPAARRGASRTSPGAGSGASGSAAAGRGSVRIAWAFASSTIGSIVASNASTRRSSIGISPAGRAGPGRSAPGLGASASLARRGPAPRPAASAPGGAPADRPGPAPSAHTPRALSPSCPASLPPGRTGRGRPRSPSASG